MMPMEDTLRRLRISVGLSGSADGITIAQMLITSKYQSV